MQGVADLRLNGFAGHVHHDRELRLHRLHTAQEPQLNPKPRGEGEMGDAGRGREATEEELGQRGERIDRSRREGTIEQSPDRQGGEGNQADLPFR